MAQIYALSTVLFLLLPATAFSEDNCPSPYVKEVNGCSGAGEIGENLLGWMRDFTPDCNAHDRCFRTIGKSKFYCDRAFRADMYDTCEKEFLQPVKYVKTEHRSCRNKKWYEIGEHLKCFVSTTVDIVETSWANAEKIAQLPLYPSCITSAELYHAAVTLKTGTNTTFANRQSTTMRAAEEMAQKSADGCPLVSADANILRNSNRATHQDKEINSIFSHMENRAPTHFERTRSLNMAKSADRNWQFDVINDIKNRKFDLYESAYLDHISAGGNISDAPFNLPTVTTADSAIVGKAATLSVADAQAYAAEQERLDDLRREAEEYLQLNAEAFFATDIPG